jgi:hypothetical protein
MMIEENPIKVKYPKNFIALVRFTVQKDGVLCDEDVFYRRVFDPDIEISLRGQG